MHTSHLKHQTAYITFQTAHFKHHTTNNMLHTSHLKHHTAHITFPTAHFKHHTTNITLHRSHFKTPHRIHHISNRTFQAPHYIYHTANITLQTPHSIHHISNSTLQAPHCNESDYCLHHFTDIHYAEECFSTSRVLCHCLYFILCRTNLFSAPRAFPSI